MNSGLELIARYSFPPNSKKYCGPENSASRIMQFINGKFNNIEFLKSAFSKFEVMFPYLQLIAEANGKSPFDFEVADAYWHGSELLEKVKLEDWEKTALKIGENSGWGKKITEKYTSLISAKTLPHHSFHVLASSISTISEPEIMLEKINNCIISRGRVLNAGEKELVVERKPLALENSRLVFGEPVIEKAKNSFKESTQKIVECGKGDWVSMHWNFACKRLEKKEVQALEEFTKRNLEKFSIK